MLSMAVIIVPMSAAVSNRFCSCRLLIATTRCTLRLSYTPSPFTNVHVTQMAVTWDHMPIDSEA